MKQLERLNLLDSFRFIAIVMVLFYHYYSRWTSPISKISLYNYEYTFDVFKYGYLGVEFFFMISGFVIYFTLTKTNSFWLFLKKRFFRLFPTMVLCSLITLLVLSFFDNNTIFPNSQELQNFFFSITFLSPKIAEQFGLNLGYIDGSYWSLWVEIQFYLISSIIYFISPKKFLLCFVFISFSLFFGNIFLNSNFGSELILKSFPLRFYEALHCFNEIFNLSEYILWFLLGVLFFKLFQNKKDYKLMVIVLFASFIQLYFLKIVPIILISLSFILLFITMIYKPNWMRFLNNKFLARIGVVSYSLYLIHQNIGVLIINKLSDKVQGYLFLVPLLIMIILINFSFLSFKYFEKPISVFLNRLKK